MGAGNALAAITTWGPELDRYHKSRIVLMIMALHSLDDDPNPRYWGGVDKLADALGLRGSKRNRESRVSEAIRELVRVGAVTRIVDPAKGRRAEYGLHVLVGANVAPPVDHSPVTSDDHSLVTSDTTHSLGVQPLTQDECAKEDRGGLGTHRGEPLSSDTQVTSAPRSTLPSTGPDAPSALVRLCRGCKRELHPHIPGDIHALCLAKENDREVVSTSVGTRLHDAWRPSPDTITWSLGQIDRDTANRELEKFRNYWLAKPGKDAMKLDWDRTWRNWVLNSAPAARKPSTTEQRVRAALEIAAKYAAEEAAEADVSGDHIVLGDVIPSSSEAVA